ncbi:aminotransferase class I/II-fold pyridoxal phosphate-dependent enzyme [Kitasatospora aburaviensis]
MTEPVTPVTPVESVVGPHRYRNNQKMVPASEAAWGLAQKHGMLGLVVEAVEGQNRLREVHSGHEFANLSSCSYLGLNSHPTVVEAGRAALAEERITGLSMGEFRIRLGIMERLEEELSEHFGAHVLPSVSCGVLSAAILPLLASGHLTDGEPLVVVFDRFAHFSMNFLKPVLADETLVLTCPHNDLAYLEEVCRKYPRVAYVCEGVYSVGGQADLAGIKALQERYGMFVYLDDSHAMSAVGERGVGFARTVFDELDSRTIVVASIAKAFGSTGGIAMTGDRGVRLPLPVGSAGLVAGAAHGGHRHHPGRPGGPPQPRARRTPAATGPEHRAVRRAAARARPARHRVAHQVRGHR